MEIDPELPSGSFPILITMSRVVTAYEVKDSLQVKMGDWLIPGTVTEQGDNYVITYAPADFKAKVLKDGSDVITCTHRFGQTVEEIMWTPPSPVIEQTLMYRSNGEKNYIVNEQGRLISDGTNVFRETLEGDPLDPFHTGLYYPTRLRAEELASLIDNWGDLVLVLYKAEAYNNYVITYGTYADHPKLYEFSRGFPQFELNEYRQ